MGFPQIAIGENVGILIPWENHTPGPEIFFKKNTFMNATCYMWNNYPNISRIQFYLDVPVETYESDTQTKNIYAFLIIETIIFMILSILIFNTTSSARSLINLLISLFILMWIISVGFDIRGTENYDTLNGFVYQNTYNVRGKVFPSKSLTNASDKEMGVYFYGQSTFVRQVCDMRNYFYYNGDYWFMTFKDCNPMDNFLDTNKICSIMLKSISLFMLIVANVIYKWDSYEMIDD
jgi:hypothetical protein